MSEPSPNHLIEAALGYEETAAINAALALDLFTAIASEEGNIEKTAKRVKASPRGIRILCDYLTVRSEEPQERGYRTPWSDPSPRSRVATRPVPVEER